MDNKNIYIGLQLLLDALATILVTLLSFPSYSYVTITVKKKGFQFRTQRRGSHGLHPHTPKCLMGAPRAGEGGKEGAPCSAPESLGPHSVQETLDQKHPNQRLQHTRGQIGSTRIKRGDGARHAELTVAHCPPLSLRTDLPEPLAISPLEGLPWKNPRAPETSLQKQTFVGLALRLTTLQ